MSDFSWDSIDLPVFTVNICIVGQSRSDFIQVILFEKSEHVN